MEMNGPANIIMMCKESSDAADNDKYYMSACIWYENQIEKIDKEAQMTINYLKEIDAVLKKHGLEKEIPFWHEVKEKYK